MDLNQLDIDQLFEWVESIATSLVGIEEALKNMLEWMQR